jgi:hypothetical protein
VAHSLGVDRAKLHRPIHHTGRGGDLNKKGSDMNGQRDLEGMSALVTGTTSGIGKAVAEEADTAPKSLWMGAMLPEAKRSSTPLPRTPARPTSPRPISATPPNSATLWSASAQ